MVINRPTGVTAVLDIPHSHEKSDCIKTVVGVCSHWEYFLLIIGRYDIKFLRNLMLLSLCDSTYLQYFPELFSIDFLKLDKNDVPMARSEVEHLKI